MARRRRKPDSNSHNEAPLTDEPVPSDWPVEGVVDGGGPGEPVVAAKDEPIMADKRDQVTFAVTAYLHVDERQCAICGTAAKADERTCRNCGEASWL